MICPKCNQQVPDSCHFCILCGHRLTQVDIPVLTCSPKRESGCGKIILCFFCIVVAIGAFVSNVSSPAVDEKSNSSTSPKNALGPDKIEPGPAPTAKPYKAEISPNAVYKYPETAQELKKKGFPKMLQKYGIEGIKKINRLMPKVAEKASLNNSMDRIVYVDLSDNRSTKDKLVFCVGAENSNRIYISESDLDSDKTVMSDQELLRKLLPVHVEMCENLIKANLTYPSTYDKHIFDSVSQTQEYTNVIRIAFSAKNAYNLEIDYVAIFRVNAQSKVVYQDIREKQ